MDERTLIKKYSGRISELRYDEHGAYKLINGEKVYQIIGDDRLNDIINSVRASGMSAFELLKDK